MSRFRAKKHDGKRRIANQLDMDKMPENQAVPELFSRFSCELIKTKSVVRIVSGTLQFR